MKRLLYLAALSVAAVLVLAPAALAQSGDLDCSHFATQGAPQAILDAHPTGLDMYELDADGDGIACESLGGGALEDGTAASVQQYQAVTAGSKQASGVTELADTGGPPLLVPAAAAVLFLGSCVLRLLAVARRNRRVRDLGETGEQVMTNVGANAKRLTAVMLAVALAAAVAIGAGQERSASAQTNSPLAISKSVHPSPVSAIPIGTHIDYLITEYNNSPYPYP